MLELNDKTKLNVIMLWHKDRIARAHADNQELRDYWLGEWVKWGLGAKDNNPRYNSISQQWLEDFGDFSRWDHNKKSWLNFRFGKLCNFLAWQDFGVKADDVADFMARYYKPERYTGRGEEYAAGLLASNRADFDNLGYCIISHWDSVTGRCVAFYSGKLPDDLHTPTKHA